MAPFMTLTQLSNLGRLARMYRGKGSGRTLPISFWELGPFQNNFQSYFLFHEMTFLRLPNAGEGLGN